MPDSLLQILKLLLLAVILLFFFRVLRAVWASLAPPAAPLPTPSPDTAPARTRRPSRGRTRPEAPAAPHLTVIDPSGDQGRSFAVADEMTVGRAPGCAVNLTDGSVSQVHARLFRQDGQLWVEDLGSRNGTFVNQRKVNAPQKLKPGDQVRVGATTLEVGA